MMLHQVELLIEGYLLPPTIGKLCVSEKLIFEKVWRGDYEYRLSHESNDYAIAYVGVDAQEETNFFLAARDYLDFFLLIYSLISAQPVTRIMGIGTTLDNMTSLGTKRFSFSGFEKIIVHNEREDDLLCKPILEAKKRFLLLLPDRQRIMESPLGLALIYYYFAVVASRIRLDEVIIDLIISAEALLITRNEGIRGNLSRRLSALIAENEIERAEISKKIRELYDLRSAIVHGGGGKPAWNDVQILSNYVKRAIEMGLSLRQLSKGQLLAKLDNRN